MSPGILVDSGAGGEISDRSSIQTAPISTTTLADGEFIGFRIQIPSGFVLKVYSIGVQNDSNNTPAGLEAQIRDETNATSVFTSNQKRESGDPLASKNGPFDAFMRINNGTGVVQNASAAFGYFIEEQ